MELTEKEWHTIEHMLPKLPTGKRGRPWRGIERCYLGFSGFFARVCLGRIYRRSIHRIKHATVVFSNGLGMARWRKC